MVGLGRMGMNMARRLVEKGHTVYGYNKPPDKVKTAEGYGIRGVYSLKELAESLNPPRVVWIMVPHGRPVDEVIEGIKEYLQRGDIIIDGGNSHYRDAIRRAEELEKDGIHFVDVGTSGGIWGLKEGYCLMIGGRKEVYQHLEPLFESLAQKEGYLYCGRTGAGHFVKMVHNGIEYAMMEAYAEGFELIWTSPYREGIDFAKLSNLWNHGSVIRSWLLELIGLAFRKDAHLDTIKGYVEDSGEGRWMVKEAVDMGVHLPAITEALFRRFRSRLEDSFAERLLAAMRREFGGHRVKQKKERKKGSKYARK